jgi:hypothetical protein
MAKEKAPKVLGPASIIKPALAGVAVLMLVQAFVKG